MNYNKEIIVVGVKSQFGTFICKHPIIFLFLISMCAEILMLLLGENIYKSLHALKILLISYSVIYLLSYVSTRKWCYKILLDNTNNTITFYSLFNRGTRILPLNKIKIVIDSYCHIFINGSENILHADYIHDLVSFLPKDTIIEYKGRIGKYKESNWIKGPLIPGNRLIIREK